MFSQIWNACKSLFNRVRETVKQWIKPANVTLAVGAITELSRSKTDLVLAN